MSAKKNLDQTASDPKTLREAQQRKAEKRSNLMYGTIAVIFVVVAIIEPVFGGSVYVLTYVTLAAMAVMTLFSAIMYLEQYIPALMEESDK